MRLGSNWNSKVLTYPPCTLTSVNAGHAAQRRRDFPVEECSQVHRRQTLAADLELQHFAQGRRQRAKLWLAAPLQFVAGVGQSLIDELPRPIDVDPPWKTTRS